MVCGKTIVFSNDWSVNRVKRLIKNGAVVSVRGVRDNLLVVDFDKVVFVQVEVLK